MMQTDKSATLSTHNTQTLFDPIPIADKATRYKGGGDTRNNDGSANGLGIGEPGAPANTLTAADRHGVACFAQQAIGEYEESEKASGLKRRDYKDSTDLILWEYIIRRLTPLECCRLQGFPDNWAEELGITEPTQEDIDHWREVFRTQMEAMGESKKEKTDNQICKWLKDPESDQAAGSRLEQDGAKFGAPQSKRKSQEGGKNQWQKRIKASVCFLKWDVERR